MICVHSICIILLLRHKYSNSLQHWRNWFQTPIPIDCLPSIANGGAPVPAPMVALHKGTIKIRPRFCRLERSRRRGPDRRRGWNIWVGGSRGFPSGHNLCRSLRHCHHCRRWWDNSGGSVGSSRGSHPKYVNFSCSILSSQFFPTICNYS